jgi:hypothetical protein
LPKNAKINKKEKVSDLTVHISNVIKHINPSPLLENIEIKKVFLYHVRDP